MVIVHQRKQKLSLSKITNVSVYKLHNSCDRAYIKYPNTPLKTNKPHSSAIPAKASAWLSTFSSFLFCISNLILKMLEAPNNYFCKSTAMSCNTTELFWNNSLNVGYILMKISWNTLINCSIKGAQNIQVVKFFMNCNYLKQTYTGTHWNCLSQCKKGNEEIKLRELRVFQYLDLREGSFDVAHVFHWINVYSVLKWNIIENACNFTSNFSETFKRIINSEKWFDNSGLVKIFVE